MLRRLKAKGLDVLSRQENPSGLRVLRCKVSAIGDQLADLPQPSPCPSCRNVMLNFGFRHLFKFPYFDLLSGDQVFSECCHSLHRQTRQFIIWILRHQLSLHGQLQNGLAELGDGGGGVEELVELVAEAVGVGGEFGGVAC